MEKSKNQIKLDFESEKGLYSIAQAADKTGISRSTLLEYEGAGLFPPPAYKLGHNRSHRRWTGVQLEEFMRSLRNNEER